MEEGVRKKRQGRGGEAENKRDNGLEDYERKGIKRKERENQKMKRGNESRNQNK